MKYVVIAWAILITIAIIILLRMPLGIEPLTELYFENHNNLPKQLSLGQKAGFWFTIHNLEYRKMRYSYKVSYSFNNKTLLLKKGTVTVNNNQSLSIPVTFSINEPFTRAEVDVILIDKDNSIHFWVDEK